MINRTTTCQSIDSFKNEDNSEVAEIPRLRRKKRSGRSKKTKPASEVVVSSDEECGSEKKNKRRSVSFNEENTERVEIPRISRRYKTKCWITKEEIQHNVMMNKVRGMVRSKLISVMAKEDDIFEDADETETETTESETEGDDDLLEGLSQREGEIHKEEQRSNARMVHLARKDRIIQHLLDAIMERRNEDIHSFLTSKCSITFSTKKK